MHDKMQDAIPMLAFLGILCGMLGIVGWIFTTWLRVKNGYPLDGSWGQALYPKGNEATERVKLLSQENAQLRAELAGVKDRLAVLERLATDSGARLSDSIEQLRNPRIN